MRVTYNGPIDEVEVPDLGVTVKRGESIDVFNDDFAAQMIEQSCWDAQPSEVLAWVGKSRERATVMLRAEQDGAERPDVLSKLDRLANPPEPKPTAAQPETKQEKGTD